LYFLPRMVAYRLLQANPCTRKAAHHTRTHTHTQKKQCFGGLFRLPPCFIAAKMSI
jgi:hypothetical protein